VILAEHRFSIEADKGVISVRGGRGVPWSQSTLVQVHEAGAFADVNEGTHLWVITAHQWGPWDVAACILDGPPVTPEDDWEDVAEVSLTCGAGLYITEVIDEGAGVTLDAVPGTYRVRVSARGRAADWWEKEQEHPVEDGARPPVEHYLIEAWLAPASPPEDLRESSTYARVARGSV
jgi:hypothetical protein